MKSIMLLGSGELGKEFVIAAKRLGLYVIAVDRYEGAPAMALADEWAAINMLDESQLLNLVDQHKPDLIVPEVEAIRTEALLKIEATGVQVVPTARATHMTMNRDAIRDWAAETLKLRTARYAYAHSADELENVSQSIGFPCVVKPVMSSSGKGQTIVKKQKDIRSAWDYACAGMRGDQRKVIVEEFIDFELEITLLTVKQFNAPTVFVKPIGHRQELGDYRESWLPAKMKPLLLKQAEKMAKKVTDGLGGAGLYGVEFFVTKKEVIFSELSPRPHDTGMVTLISQDLSEFELHLRAILGLPIPEVHYYGAAASAVILADREASQFRFHGLDQALKKKSTQIRLFGKPKTLKNRRMGVALALAENTEKARKKAFKAAQTVHIEYGE